MGLDFFAVYFKQYWRLPNELTSYWQSSCSYSYYDRLTVKIGECDARSQVCAWVCGKRHHRVKRMAHGGILPSAMHTELLELPDRTTIVHAMRAVFTNSLCCYVTVT